MKKILADRMKCIDSSGIRKVFALAAQMKDPINFSIGQPDFDTPEPIKREAIRAIERGANKYSDGRRREAAYQNRGRPEGGIRVGKTKVDDNQRRQRRHSAGVSGPD